jgi:hypothetical protein
MQGVQEFRSSRSSRSSTPPSGESNPSFQAKTGLTTDKCEVPSSSLLELLELLGLLELLFFGLPLPGAASLSRPLQDTPNR